MFTTTWMQAVRRTPMGKHVRAPWFALFATLALSACSIVVEPTDGSTAQGNTKFWGYSLFSNDTMSLQAQNTSGGWENIRSTQSVQTATHTGDLTGYYFELTTNPQQVHSRFRRPSPYAGFSLINYRILSSRANSPAETRTAKPTKPPPSGGSNLERMWAAHKSDGIIRITIKN